MKLLTVLLSILEIIIKKEKEKEKESKVTDDDIIDKAM